jgi:hypothetical protein
LIPNAFPAGITELGDEIDEGLGALGALGAAGVFEIVSGGGVDGFAELVGVARTEPADNIITLANAKAKINVKVERAMAAR